MRKAKKRDKRPLRFIVSQAERKEIEGFALAMDLTVSGYIRQCLNLEPLPMGRPPKPKR